ncbi:MAG: hypothetical protein QW041_02870 [Candidatus Pacearchaeota archaeon]
MAKKNLEYKIGFVEGFPDNESKYIIAKEGKFLVWYSANLRIRGGEKPYHRTIAEDNGISERRVLGGGKFVIENGILKIYDYSSSFGGVPKIVADVFANMLKEYLKDKYTISNLKIEPLQVYVNEKTRKEWKKLGLLK